MKTIEINEVLIRNIIDNKDGLYKGSLAEYFVICFLSDNAFNPYHNFRHTMTVVCETYKAILHYQNKLNKNEVKALLIAAFFHDFNHSGKNGNEGKEIENAIIAMENNLLEADKGLSKQIKTLIKATQYPYHKMVNSLSEKIIRDADLSQALFDVWIQQVIFGLAKEHGQRPLEMLKKQIPFLSQITFHTTWAEEHYRPLVNTKLEIVNYYLKLFKKNGGEHVVA
ncbi:MAG: 3',5'-cyclic nucleotide phosphodiesterase [Candidatus Pacebacteria bacterium]|nr:3',5'-cyclic nucleotide phosphodiesterase [Candidatus Paceibacterota bacterium]